MENRVLGDYQIIKQVGQGSLGTVLLAEHKFMKRQYVLKMLPAELSQDRNFIQRFEEEVTAISFLDHPNIVKIYNISFADGQYFLVTDCIVDALGETTHLAKYLQSRGKRLQEKEILQILRQIADALDYAHSKKPGGKVIVHRNLKLNNILIGKGSEGIKTYITDFGLSRIIGPGAFLTRTFRSVAEALNINTGKDGYVDMSNDVEKLQPLHTSFLQNYAFLAPEQKRLEKNIDSKADIYAFGVLAYYLIAGEFPEGVFDMPSELDNGFRGDWDILVSKCLHQNPKKRPQALLPILDLVERKHTAEQLVIPEVQEKISEAEQFVAAVSLKPVIHSSKIERPQVDSDPASAFRTDTAIKHYTPERKIEVKEVQPLLTDMVIIKGGRFWRGSEDGSRDEKPRHMVNLSSFAIDIHPVTNEQFVRFLEALGGVKDANHNDIIRHRESRIKKNGGKFGVESGYSKHPVVGVTWYGAVAYADWIGKRLPTEAEWEIAARQGEDSIYPTGDDIEKTQANFFSSDTTPVMSYAPNKFGLYDMAGNVYEWIYDWYGYNYYETSAQEPDEPKGPLQGVYRVIRGGCWKSVKEDLRSSRRHRNNPGTVNGTYGFRCAADVA